MVHADRLPSELFPSLGNEGVPSQSNTDSFFKDEKIPSNW